MRQKLERQSSEVVWSETPFLGADEQWKDGYIFFFGILCSHKSIRI